MAVQPPQASSKTTIAMNIANTESQTDRIMLAAASASDDSQLIDISPFNIDGQTMVPASVALELARDNKEWARSLKQLIGTERENEATWFKEFMRQLESIIALQ